MGKFRFPGVVITVTGLRVSDSDDALAGVTTRVMSANFGFSTGKFRFTGFPNGGLSANFGFSTGKFRFAGYPSRVVSANFGFTMRIVMFSVRFRFSTDKAIVWRKEIDRAVSANFGFSVGKIRFPVSFRFSTLMGIPWRNEIVAVRVATTVGQGPAIRVTPFPSACPDYLASCFEFAQSF